MEYKELFDNINKLLIEDESKINYEDLTNQIKELKQKFPNLKITQESSFKCFGPCLEDLKTYTEDQLISIPGDDHQFCPKCLTNWVLSSFLTNPFRSIWCQRCQAESSVTLIPEDIIYSIIPANTVQHYQNYFRNLYFNCAVCNNLFPYASLVSMLCGHFFCQSDFVLTNLKTYQSIIKGKTENSQDLLEFQIICVCNNFSTKDSQSLAFFNNLARNLDAYNPLKFFYSKFQDFFEGKSRLNFLNCCKKYKILKNLAISNCYKCNKCRSCNQVIHEGLTCNDFQGFSKKYSIVESDFWTPDEVEKVTPSFVRLIVQKFLSNIRRIYKIFNEFQEISKRFKRVWEYGFVFCENLESFQKFCNFDQLDFIEIKKNLDVDAKFVLLCEVHGDKTDRGHVYEGKDRVIYDFDDYYKVSNRDQVRFLYLIEMNAD